MYVNREELETPPNTMQFSTTPSLTMTIKYTYDKCLLYLMIDIKYTAFWVICYVQNCDWPITTTININNFIFHHHHCSPSEAAEWDLKTASICLVSAFDWQRIKAMKHNPWKLQLSLRITMFGRILLSLWRGNKLPSKHAYNQAANKYTRIARQECSHS